MRNLKSNTVVIKIGTSSLTYKNGKMKFRRIDELARVISDLKNLGKNVVLVSSGAIGVGMAKLNMSSRPDDVQSRQALAAVGQCALMDIYERSFLAYGYNVAQVLMTKYTIDTEPSRKNVVNTFERLLEMNVVPIVNENDVIATEEIEFGDNDTLSAYVAKLVSADLLIIMTDIDGFYNKNPKTHSDAKLIHELHEIDDEVMECAGGAVSALGTGGMYTKLVAGKIALESNVSTIIVNGEEPKIIYDIIDGKEIGTIITKNKFSTDI